MFFDVVLEGTGRYQQFVEIKCHLQILKFCLSKKLGASFNNLPLTTSNTNLPSSAFNEITFKMGYYDRWKWSDMGLFHLYKYPING